MSTEDVKAATVTRAYPCSPIPDPRDSEISSLLARIEADAEMSTTEGTTMFKYYIATRLENHAAHNEVRDALAALGHAITYDWTTHGPVWTKGVEAIKRVALAERDGVEAADVVIVLLPGGRGTHAELGIAIGRRVPIIIYSQDERVHGATPETCAFYHAPDTLPFNGTLQQLAAFVHEAMTLRISNQDRCLVLANDDSGEPWVPKSGLPLCADVVSSITGEAADVWVFSGVKIATFVDPGDAFRLRDLINQNAEQWMSAMWCEIAGAFTPAHASAPNERRPECYCPFHPNEYVDHPKAVTVRALSAPIPASVPVETSGPLESLRAEIERRYARKQLGSGAVGGTFGEILCHEIRHWDDPRPAGKHFARLAEEWDMDLHTLGALIADHCNKLCPRDVGEKGHSTPARPESAEGGR